MFVLMSSFVRVLLFFYILLRFLRLNECILWVCVCVFMCLREFCNVSGISIVMYVVKML